MNAMDTGERSLSSGQTTSANYQIVKEVLLIHTISQVDQEVWCTICPTGLLYAEDVTTIPTWLK
jgi:hypothetical protein